MYQNPKQTPQSECGCDLFTFQFSRITRSPQIPPLALRNNITKTSKIESKNKLSISKSKRVGQGLKESKREGREGNYRKLTMQEPSCAMFTNNTTVRSIEFKPRRMTEVKEVSYTSQDFKGRIIRVQTNAPGKSQPEVKSGYIPPKRVEYHVNRPNTELQFKTFRSIESKQVPPSEYYQTHLQPPPPPVHHPYIKKTSDITKADTDHDPIINLTQNQISFFPSEPVSPTNRQSSFNQVKYFPTVRSGESPKHPRLSIESAFENQSLLSLKINENKLQGKTVLSENGDMEGDEESVVLETFIAEDFPRFLHSSKPSSASLQPTVCSPVVKTNHNPSYSQEYFNEFLSESQGRRRV